MSPEKRDYTAEDARFMELAIRRSARYWARVNRICYGNTKADKVVYSRAFGEFVVRMDPIIECFVIEKKSIFY